VQRLMTKAGGKPSNLSGLDVIALGAAQSRMKQYENQLKIVNAATQGR
jgi:hypothetical protein